MSGLEPIELAWAAGFYEGEGCCSLGRTIGRASSKYYHYNPRVTISQVDKEPLEKFMSIVEIGHIRGPYSKGQVNPIYYYSICKFEHVQHLMCLLWNNLSKRRQTQFSIVFRGYHEYRENPHLRQRGHKR